MVKPRGKYSDERRLRRQRTRRFHRDFFYGLVYMYDTYCKPRVSAPVVMVNVNRHPGIHAVSVVAGYDIHDSADPDNRGKRPEIVDQIIRAYR
jgi:hypothetical protein